MSDQARTARVYCGNATRERGSFEEPEECSWEGDVPLPVSPEDDAYASWTCPGCGLLNTVRDHQLAVRVFYFGCWREAGHYLWHRGTDGTPGKKYDQGESDRLLLGVSQHSRGGPTKGEIPWGYALDGGLLNGKSLRQGEAVVEQRDGWTAISFWDNSVDSRPGSSSTFVFDALLDPEQALRAAREAFPPIFARFDFEVVLADG